jgi:hypothetical protein
MTKRRKWSLLWIFLYSWALGYVLTNYAEENIPFEVVLIIGSASFLYSVAAWGGK